MTRLPLTNKFTFIGLSPNELALTCNMIIHDLEHHNYRTVNITIKKDGDSFNLILIVSQHSLDRSQIIEAVKALPVTQSDYNTWRR